MGYLGSVRNVLTKDFSRASDAEKEETVRHVIEVCSFACAGLVLQPVPLLEQAILPIQAGMVVGIAHVYGEPRRRSAAPPRRLPRPQRRLTRKAAPDQDGRFAHLPAIKSGART